MLSRTDQENQKTPAFSPNEIYAVAGFFGFILGIFIYTFFTPYYYSQDPPVQIEIKEGKTLTTVIDTLYAKEVIPSKFNMKVAAFLYGAETKIKAGRYNIPNGLSYLDLLEVLIEGAPEKQKLVTIPEGIWQFKLAGLLQKELGIDSTRFMALSENKSFLRSIGIETDNLEGYLLPNTFYFYYDSSEEEVIRRLKKHMDELFDEEAMRRLDELDMTKHELLTLASIIDAETNIESEFGTVSGVYHNRLKIGMLLQADPTVQYLIRHRKSPFVYLKDLEIDSPFNTYKNAGLPPKPLNNPGKEAILAALYPEEHNYYYFVADGTGGHKFGRNHAEHLRNVSEYRRWQRNQRLRN